MSNFKTLIVAAMTAVSVSAALLFIPANAFAHGGGAGGMGSMGHGRETGSTSANFTSVAPTGIPTFTSSVPTFTSVGPSSGVPGRRP
jgi:hypothetical protein